MSAVAPVFDNKRFNDALNLMKRVPEAMRAQVRSMYLENIHPSHRDIAASMLALTFPELISPLSAVDLDADGRRLEFVTPAAGGIPPLHVPSPAPMFPTMNPIIIPMTADEKHEDPQPQFSYPATSFPNIGAGPQPQPQPQQHQQPKAPTPEPEPSERSAAPSASSAPRSTISNASTLSALSVSYFAGGFSGAIPPMRNPAYDDIINAAFDAAEQCLKPNNVKLDEETAWQVCQVHKLNDGSSNHKVKPAAGKTIEKEQEAWVKDYNAKKTMFTDAIATILSMPGVFASLRDQKRKIEEKCAAYAMFPRTNRAVKD